MEPLLISERAIKELTTLSDNLFGEYIAPTIYNCQTIYLQETIGSCLYNKLLSLVSDGTITASTNSNYKYLLDNQIKNYLAWQVAASIVPLISIKTDNAGSVKNTDEHRTTLTTAELDIAETNFQKYADSYRRMLQDFLKENAELYQELEQCSCTGIKPNLESSNSSRIWTGGYYGKRMP